MRFCPLIGQIRDIDHTKRQLRQLSAPLLPNTQDPFSAQGDIGAVSPLRPVCVLLVACANVTGLLLSRATMRAREIALRLAVGANRSSLIRQLMLENLLLSLAGGAAGLIVAVGAVDFFNSLPIPTDIPISLTFQLDQRALLFTLAVAVFSTFFFGLTPALGTTKVDLMQGLKERTGRRPGAAVCGAAI